MSGEKNRRRRPNLPGAYSVLFAAKVTSETADAIDAARGDLDRTAWLRSAIDRLLEEQEAPTARDWHRRALDAEDTLREIRDLAAAGLISRHSAPPLPSDTEDEQRRFLWMLIRRAGGQVVLTEMEQAECPPLPGLRWGRQFRPSGDAVVVTALPPGGSGETR